MAATATHRGSLNGSANRVTQVNRIANAQRAVDRSSKAKSRKPLPVSGGKVSKSVKEMFEGSVEEEHEDEFMSSYKPPTLKPRTTRIVMWKDITPLKWNPSQRSKALGDLPKSIADFNMLLPIVCDPNLKMIDGMRRYTAVGPDYLNWPKVEVLIEENQGVANAFRELNYNRKGMKASDTLEMYLAGTESRMGLPSRIRTILDELWEITASGPKDKRPKIMVAMKDARMSSEPFYTAKYIGRELLMDEKPATIKRILRYFLATRCSHSARRAVQTDVITKKGFLAAMSAGKPITVTYQTDKPTGRPTSRQPKRYGAKKARRKVS
jgi:hypothetical protein